MITLHAYRSWSEDNPKGYYQHGQKGVRKPNPSLAAHRRLTAKHPPRRFNTDQKHRLIEHSQQKAKQIDIRLHASSCTPTHLHLVASWHGTEVVVKGKTQALLQAKHVAAKMKTSLATRLSNDEGTAGNRWFSRGCDCAPVVGREHFNHLLESYLPKHLNEGGVVKIFDKGETTP